MFCPCCNNKVNQLKLVPHTVNYVVCVRGHRFELVGLDPQEVVVVVTTDKGCDVGDRFDVPAGTVF